MPIIESRPESLKTDIPDFSSGDTIKVYQKIKEGDKERVQIFEGLVIARHGKVGINTSFTVRKIASGIGVERIFQLHSPAIAKIEVSKQGNVRQAKLYYVRERANNQPRFKASKAKAKK